MILRSTFKLLPALLSAVFLVSCGQTKTVPSPLATGATNQQIFQVKGTIRGLEPARKKAIIAHEKIPDYMDAMTMEFDVRDAQELAGLATNDLVSFRMIVTDTDGWIDQLKKIGTGIASALPEGVRIARDVDPLNVGDLLPEYRFTNEFGRPFRLSDFKGQALGFTFIFTRCPYPTFCPRLSSSFAEAYTQLKTMPNAPTNWHLISITIDPEFDTPAILEAYGRRYNYDSNRWNFATAELIDITAIAEQFGLYFTKENGTINHLVRTVVVDTLGRVQWVTKENEWKPEVLVGEMVKAAKVK